MLSHILSCDCLYIVFCSFYHPCLLYIYISYFILWLFVDFILVIVCMYCFFNYILRSWKNQAKSNQMLFPIQLAPILIGSVHLANCAFAYLDIIEFESFNELYKFPTLESLNLLSSRVLLLINLFNYWDNPIYDMFNVGQLIFSFLPWSLWDFWTCKLYPLL